MSLQQIKVRKGRGKGWNGPFKEVEFNTKNAIASNTWHGGDRLSDMLPLSKICIVSNTIMWLLAGYGGYQLIKNHSATVVLWFSRLSELL